MDNNVKTLQGWYDEVSYANSKVGYDHNNDITPEIESKLDEIDKLTKDIANMANLELCCLHTLS